MRGFIIRAAIVGLGLWAASALVPGIEIGSGRALIEAAVLLAVVNAIVRPVVILLTLPITLLTLGLFLLVVNGLMIELVSALLKPGFFVTGLGPAVLASIIVSITGWLVNGFIGPEGRVEVITYRRL
ncbi:MAG: phage holin family protein [Roseiarcus sp.]